MSDMRKIDIDETMITAVVVVIVIFAVAILASALAEKGVHALLQMLRF